jgi:hypothetical protein
MAAHPDNQPIQSFEERIAGFEKEIADKKIKFPPDIFNYIQDNILALQRILHEGRMPTEKEMEFMDHVRLWLSLQEEDRKTYTSIEAMIKYGGKDIIQCAKRGISFSQWFDLGSMLSSIQIDSFDTTSLSLLEKIDATFKFPGNGVIRHESTLNLNMRNKLGRLPDGLDIEDDFNMEQSPFIAKLPKRLKVGGGFAANDCRALYEIPDDISIGMSVILNRTPITILPDCFREVKGSLHLENCKNLEKLPDNLNVHGDLNLKGCHSLKQLPTGLVVNGDKDDRMDISHCTALEGFPDDMQVNAILSLSADLNKKVLADALKLKQEGKIRDIKYP